MAALIKIRSERDQMSAIERRIADYILENARSLRDYSSQQLASALGISQSSVVKFSQKLGYRGYPDLKLAINEAVARTGKSDNALPEEHVGESTKPAAGLWQRKSAAEEATRLINPREALAHVADAIQQAGTVFIIGLGEDDLHARTFALRLSLLGFLTVHNFDTAHMTASLSAARPGDVLLVFSEYGMQPTLCQLARCLRDKRGKVVSITRHSANALRTQADIALLVSAHDEQSHIAPLLYHSALQHLLDRVYIRLCESDAARCERLRENLARIQPLLDN